MNRAELSAEMRELRSLLDSGIRALRKHSKLEAEAERDYRKAKAQAWVRCPTDESGVKAGEREWTAARREAWVDAECADLRYARDLAAGESKAALEAVRARRGEISALQSELAADRAEAQIAAYAPEYTP